MQPRHGDAGTGGCWPVSGPREDGSPSCSLLRDEETPKITDVDRSSSGRQIGLSYEDSFAMVQSCSRRARQRRSAAGLPSRISWLASRGTSRRTRVGHGERRVTPRDRHGTPRRSRSTVSSGACRSPSPARSSTTSRCSIDHLTPWSSRCLSGRQCASCVTTSRPPK